MPADPRRSAPAPGGWRLAERYRHWAARSITNRVTVTALGLAVAVAVLLFATAYVTIRHLIDNLVSAEIESQARLVEQDFTSSLSAAARDVGSLAANSFVANGLVDSDGRDTYLLPFLREHHLPTAAPATLVLCDFKGRPIASNAPRLPAAEPGAAAAVRTGAATAVVERGAGRVELVLSLPVVFPPTGHREGVLVARIDLAAELAAAARARDPDVETALYLGTEEVLRRPRQRPGAAESAAVRALELPPPLDALDLRLLLEHGTGAFAPFRQVGLAFLLVGVGTLVLVAGAARHGARLLTRRMAVLRDAAREIAAGSVQLLPAGPEPHDEVETVASAFNLTLARLRAVQDSLERTVQERTADLVAREKDLVASRTELRALAARLDSVREEEQARIAADLHDRMGQLLTALKMNLRWIERNLEVLPPEGPNAALLDHAVDASELVDQAIASVQDMAAALRPGVLDWLGLESALRQEARRFEQRAGIPCEFRVEAGLPAPGGPAATALYRIAVEALTNVARHAAASRVRISLAAEGGRYCLRVEDDGRGLPPGPPRRQALGLVGMRERAERLGGTVVITPGAPRGTVVAAYVPALTGAPERPVP